MWLIGLGALLTQAPVVVHLQVAENVAVSRAKGLTQRFVEEAKSASGLEVKALEGQVCGDQDACAKKLRAQTGATQVLLLRLFGGITTIGVVVESKGQIERASLDSDAPESWPAVIRSMVRQYWPEPVRVSPPQPPAVKATAPPASTLDVTAVTQTPSPQHTKSFAGPWVFLSSGLALGIVSAVLWGTADSSRRSLEEKLSMVDPDGKIVEISFDAATDAYGSINLRRNLSGASLGAMSAALVVAFVWWLTAR